MPLTMSERWKLVDELIRQYQQAMRDQDWDSANSIPRIPGSGQIPGDAAWRQYFWNVKPGHNMWAVAKAYCSQTVNWRDDPIIMAKWRADVSRTLKALRRSFLGPLNKARGGDLRCREEGTENSLLTPPEDSKQSRALKEAVLELTCAPASLSDTTSGRQSMAASVIFSFFCRPCGSVGLGVVSKLQLCAA
jgi:hypothetical protein